MIMACEQDLTLDNTTPEVPLPGTQISQEVPLLENPISQVSIQPEEPICVLENPVQMEMTIIETTVKPVDPLPEAPVIQPPEEPIITPPPDVSVSQDTDLQHQDSTLVALEAEDEEEAQAAPTQISLEPCPAEIKEPAPEPVQGSNSFEGSLSTNDVQTNGLSEEVSSPPVQLEPTSVCHCEPTMVSPIAQPEELLTNGEGSPGLQELDAQDIEEEAHVSPITEPEEQPVSAANPTPEEESAAKEPPAESEQAPSQVPKQTSDVPVAGNKSSIASFKFI